MLSFFTDPYPNELMYSAFARYHFYSGNIDLKDTLIELFGKNSIVPSFEIGSHFKFLCNELGKNYNPDNLIQKHTLFSFYAPFLPHNRKKELLKDIVSLDSKSIYTKIGIIAGSICKKDGIHYCSVCASEDIEKFGEAYIHREHQLQGIMMCPHHGQLLKIYSIKRCEKSRIEYIRLDASLLDLSTIYLYQGKYDEALLKISNAAYYLLINDLSDISKADILLRYKNLLYEKNLATHKHRVKQDELHDMIVGHYGTELLKMLESELEKNDEYNWLRVATRGVARTVHPLRHILLILFLVGDMDTFFKGIRQAYNPFGKGPWPCLNRASEHYHQGTITRLEITADYKTRKPVGTFTCDCGYVYSRTGPDIDENDRYCRGRVKAFGDIWEDKINALLNEQSHSYHEMAIQLGCDIKTIHKFEARLLEKSAIGLDNNQMNHNVPERFLTLEYRDKLLCVIKDNPELSRTEIRGICQKEYTFLYRHNKEWLFTVLPTGRLQRGSRGDVDWDKRDHDVLSQLQKARIKLLNREKPIRISKTSLGKTIANAPLLEKCLNKLPCCADFIEKVSETKQQFQLRRCRVVVMKMQREGLPLLDWKIQREAGLRKKDYELIKDELNLILYEIDEDL